MYNKLFTKILDSSIWMEETPTRLIWITFLAVMDEEGMCLFASVANLAHRARVTMKEAEEAVERLEDVDPHSSDPDNEGRRVERVPGGWIVLNADKYRRLVTREVVRERTRERVAKHREKKRAETQRNADVTACNAAVTPSDSDSDSDSDSNPTPTTCAEPEEPAAAPVMVFPCVGKPSVSWPLLTEKLDEWQESYPDMDVPAACRQARQWCIDHTSQRKTFKGMTRFLGDWLGRSQNRGDHRKTDTQPTEREIAYWQAPNPCASFHDEAIETLTAGAAAGNPYQAKMLEFIKKHR